MPLCAFLLSRKPVRHVLITALVLFIAGNAMTLVSPDLMFYIGSRFVAGSAPGCFSGGRGAGTQLVEPGFQGRALSVIWGANCAGASSACPWALAGRRMGWKATVVLILVLAAFACGHRHPQADLASGDSPRR